MTTPKAPIVSKQFLLPFILIVTCFAAWGMAANMTDPLVKVFSKIFSMSNLQAALVQFSYYGAYFCLAIPAAFVNKKYGYKVGVLTGLGLAAAGAFLFYPASQWMTYSSFLVALFLMAGGLSILETSANPYVMAMGEDSTATRRLNLAQAFNPVGTNIGVFLAASFILPNLHHASEAERSVMSVQELTAIQAAELNSVMMPYVAMACFLLLVWVLIALTKAPVQEVNTSKSHTKVDSLASIKWLIGHKHYRYGVIAQFLNVGAQTCIWTFTIQYVMDTIGGNELDGGRYLQYSMVVFLLSRFLMTWMMGLIRPAKLLALMTVLGCGLCLFAVVVSNQWGVWAVVAVSACLSLLFPTIYSISLQGLGEDTKFGAAGLVMAILGGAILPLIQGALIDGFGAAISYTVPAVCFALIAFYAWYDLRSGRV